MQDEKKRKERAALANEVGWGEPRPSLEAGEPALHNGSYLITHERRGHFRVQVYTHGEWQFGLRRHVALMIGPNPATDFRGVAYWDEDNLMAWLKKEFEGPRSLLPLDGYHYQREDGWSPHEQKIAIFLDLAIRKLLAERVGRPVDSHFLAEGYQIQRASRCVKCNRVLADEGEKRVGVEKGCL